MLFTLFDVVTLFFTLRNVDGNCLTTIFKRSNLYFGAIIVVKQESQVSNISSVSSFLLFSFIPVGILERVEFISHDIFSHVRSASCLDKHLSDAYDASHM